MQGENQQLNLQLGVSRAAETLTASQVKHLQVGSLPHHSMLHSLDHDHIVGHCIALHGRHFAHKSAANVPEQLAAVSSAATMV